MTGEKPDLSMLRIFGSQCFVHQPEEIHGKGAARRFEAIFVGYMENRLGWLVCDLNGKLFFSRDVIFNESIPRHLSPLRGRPYLETTTIPQEMDRILCSHSKPSSLIAEIISDRDEWLTEQSITPHLQQTLQSISAFIALNSFDAFHSSIPESPEITAFRYSPTSEYSFSSTPHYPF